MPTSKKQTFREIILLFSLVILVALALMLARSLLFGQREERAVTAISLRLEDIPNENLDTLRVGDRVLDRGRRTILGTIDEITAAPHLYESVANRESVVVEKAGYCDVTLRILIENTNRRNQDGGVFYIGAGLTISTHAFAADGKIIALEDGRNRTAISLPDSGEKNKLFLKESCDRKINKKRYERREI